MFHDKSHSAGKPSLVTSTTDNHVRGQVDGQIVQAGQIETVNQHNHHRTESAVDGIHADNAATVLGVVRGPVIINQGMTATAALVADVQPVHVTDRDFDGPLLGRAAAIAAILATFAMPTREGLNGRTVVVSGMGGVGKTTLVRRCAATAVEQGRFPGGAFLVDMQGYHPGGRVESSSVFAPLMRRLNVRGDQIPATPSEQAVEYDLLLSRLAAEQKWVLLVADNVSTATQLQGLVPVPESGHRLVVTTRNTLALPGSHVESLDVLTEVDAVALLCRVLRKRRPGSRETIGVEQLAGACGRLPLALEIAAALLSEEPELTAASLAEQLIGAGIEGFVHGEIALAKVFDLSWWHLLNRDPAAARLLRLVVLHPGPQWSTDATAALAGISDSLTHVRLRVLRNAYMIRQDKRRWELHDLIRAHASTQPITTCGLTEADCSAATTRLLNHYARSTNQADRHLIAQRGAPIQNAFSNRKSAITWLDVENSNLIAATNLAAATAHHELAFQLGTSLARYLDHRRHITGWVSTARIASSSAQELGTLDELGRAANNLGMALREVRQFEESIANFRHAAAVFKEIGDPHNRGSAWTNIGVALQQQRKFQEAISAHYYAVDMFREVGFLHGEGLSLNSIGAVLNRLRRYDEAITILRRSVEIFRFAGDRVNEGMALSNLGSALDGDHGFDHAIKVYEKALAIHRKTETRHGEAVTLSSLGDTLRKLGKINESIAVHHESVRICRQIKDGHGEAHALNGLGAAFQAARRFKKAVKAHEAAIEIFKDTGDRHGEGIATVNLGLVLHDLRRPEESVEVCLRALKIFRKIGDRHAEGRTMANLGAALLGIGRVSEAHRYMEQAIIAFEETDDSSAAEGVRHCLEHSSGAVRQAMLANRRRAVDFARELRMKLTPFPTPHSDTCPWHWSPGSAGTGPATWPTSCGLSAGLNDALALPSLSKSALSIPTDVVTRSLKPSSR